MNIGPEVFGYWVCTPRPARHDLHGRWQDRAPMTQKFYVRFLIQNKADKRGLHRLYVWLDHGWPRRCFVLCTLYAMCPMTSLVLLSDSKSSHIFFQTKMFVQHIATAPGSWLVFSTSKIVSQTYGSKVSTASRSDYFRLRKRVVPSTKIERYKRDHAIGGATANLDAGKSLEVIVWYWRPLIIVWL